MGAITSLSRHHLRQTGTSKDHFIQQTLSTVPRIINLISVYASTMLNGDMFISLRGVERVSAVSGVLHEFCVLDVKIGEMILQILDDQETHEKVTSAIKNGGYSNTE